MVFVEFSKMKVWLAISRHETATTKTAWKGIMDTWTSPQYDWSVEKQILR